MAVKTERVTITVPVYLFYNKITEWITMETITRQQLLKLGIGM